VAASGGHIFDLIWIKSSNMSVTNEQSNSDYLSLTAASIAGTCNLLSWIFSQYQTYLEGHDASILFTIYLAAFDGSFVLTPLIVVIIFRRVVPITVSYALVLFFVLMGRTYYLVRLNLIGLSGVVRPFDAPHIIDDAKRHLGSCDSCLVALSFGERHRWQDDTQVGAVSKVSLCFTKRSEFIALLK
jgi:hypothetical protein